MIQEEDVRKRVKSLKRFYMDSFTFAAVNAVLILVWGLIESGATFWPKYVMVIWGIALMFKAYRMGVLPVFFHHFAFLSPEWEERKFKELTSGHEDQRRVHLNRDRKK